MEQSLVDQELSQTHNAFWISNDVQSVAADKRKTAKHGFSKPDLPKYQLLTFVSGTNVSKFAKKNTTYLIETFIMILQKELDQVLLMELCYIPCTSMERESTVSALTGHHSLVSVRQEQRQGKTESVR